MLMDAPATNPSSAARCPRACLQPRVRPLPLHIPLHTCVTRTLQLLDTKLDPVRIVAAAPDADMLTRGKGLGGRKLVVASEYEGLCRSWIESKGLDVRDAGMFA